MRPRGPRRQTRFSSSFPLLVILWLLTSLAGTAAADSRLPPAWVLRKPGPDTQVEVPAVERGVNPCLTDDPGFGNYLPWDRAPLIGQMIVPRDLGLNGHRFDVVVHFHGHEAARKDFVRHVDSAVLVGIDLGNGSGAYLDGFANPKTFELLLASVEAGVQKKLSNPALRIGNVGITSWSAGYGAVLRILSTPAGVKRVDSVALLDGLHTGYEGERLSSAKLEPVVSFAKQAQLGEKLLYVSHSSIVPPGYASTTETANYLVWRLGGKPELVEHGREFPLGLRLISTYSSGQFTVRGFRGNGRLDHCAHFGILGQVIRGRFQARWRTHKST